MRLIAEFEKRHPSLGLLKIALRVDSPHPGLIWIQGTQGISRSTFIRTLAGLESPDRGVILVDGQIWYHGDGKRSLQTPARTAALPPPLSGDSLKQTVKSVLSKALNHWPTQSRGERVRALLKLSHLTEVAGRKVYLLTEVQRRYLQLAQGLAPRPSLLLLEDFFEGLDSTSTKTLQTHLRRVLKAEGIPAILGAPPQASSPLEGEFLFNLDKGRLQDGPAAA